MNIRKWIMGIALMAGVAFASAQGLPKVDAGRVERLENFPSVNVGPRHVDVWLPDDYSPNKRYRVLYMHDGQMLFDPTITWNKLAWHVDRTMARLLREKRIPDTIVVGVWNRDGYRHAEYYPEKHLPHMPEAVRARLVKEALHGKPLADAYLRFLVEELKPAIDKKYATLPDAAHTAIMGSSMGGQISVYALCEYPHVFGRAAGLSTHWVGSFQPNASLPLAGFTYLQSHLPDPATHKLYLDRGTLDLDALYAPSQPFVDEIVRERGYTDVNFMTRVFPGTGHSETAWSQRLEIPLLFLLTP